MLPAPCSLPPSPGAGLNDNREPTMATVKQGVLGRIRAGKKGLAYSAKDLLDLGNGGRAESGAIVTFQPASIMLVLL